MSRPKKPENNEVSTTNTGKCSNDPDSAPEIEEASQGSAQVDRPTELGGQKGLEPTRYGDWEKNGRCTDF